ncbi:MAG: rhodanese-like domain-containing protein [Bacteroidota bacterium]
MKYYYLFLFLGFMACQNSNPNQAQPGEAPSNVLSPADFETQFKNTENAQLLDVRTRKEYDAGHIEDAYLINFFGADFAARLEKELDKEKPVFVYCKAGGRSAKASTKLQELGFKEVYDLEGGYTAWTRHKAR